MLQQTVYMRLVFHLLGASPVYLNIPVPDECLAALRAGKITSVDVLYHGREGDGKLVTPKRFGNSVIDDFKVIK